MTLRELVLKNRSYRRFQQDHQITMDELRDMVENIRYVPSGANCQPLRFILVADTGTGEKIFPCLKWAAYLKDWDGPVEGERPSAYIVILGNPKDSPSFPQDAGIAMQTILLGAVEKGYGGCLIGSVDRNKVREILEIPPQLELAVVIALGKPDEEIVIDEVKDGDIKYWRDENQVHHVPKRSLDELIIKKY